VQKSPRKLDTNASTSVSENLTPEVRPESPAEGVKPLDSSQIFEQDPRMVPRGSLMTPLVIPVTAIPLSRRPQIPKPPVSHPSVSHLSTITNVFKRQKVITSNEGTNEIVDLTKDDDVESMATLDEDLEVFTEYPFEELPRFLAAKLSSNSKKSSAISKLKEPFSSTEKGNRRAEILSSTNFIPGNLDYKTLPLLPPPTESALGVTKQLLTRFKDLKRTQDETPLVELGWYTDPAQFDNPFQWIVELHSFPSRLPLTKQMVEHDIPSVVLEMRFASDFPFSPPFVRVIRPRFLPFLNGGGGHVTAGGSLCMQLLTSDGWLPANDLASTLLQVRMAICSEDPRPAQLDNGNRFEYGIGEAVDGYLRAATTHGWRVPQAFMNEIRAMGAGNAESSLPK
jgi:hypothetical protein